MSDLPRGADEYLAAMRAERGLSANTVAAYRRDLSQYGRFVAERGEPSPAVVSAFVQSLSDAGRAASTVARKSAAVRGYHRFLVAEGIDETLFSELEQAAQRAVAQGSRFQFDFADEAVASKALDRVRECGGHIRSLVPKRRTLEDLFVEDAREGSQS